ncbi:MAG: hypothetical protein HDT38_01105 [Clostridiales bacterium]|nr:hypothetical protein [Clostridiales bacterium]
MKPLSDNPRLLQLLEQYSPADQNYAQLLLDIERKSRVSDMIVPILGKQGEGKSTLINAILQEDILPNEADETTCVPVEIRYGEVPGGEVYFHEDKPNLTVHTKQELSKYVDNNFNPGNEKRVSHIVMYRTLPVLKTGLVIVDLPGVGSLTAANEETTNHYIQNLSAAVFIIPTSPPILKSDASFIETVWRTFNSAYFVQNVWDDNSESDAQDGLEHNTKILSDIAKKINVPMVHPIIPVNAYAAARGAFEKDETLIAHSKIRGLFEVLTSFAEHYQEERDKAFQDRVQSVVAVTAARIEALTQMAQMSGEQIMAQMEAERNAFQQNNLEIDTLVEEIQHQLSTDKRKVRNFAGDLSRKYSELLRTELFYLIDQGIVDGEKLSNAFTDYQVQYGSDALDEVYEKFSELWEELSRKFEVLSVILNRENMNSPSASAFNKTQAFKWEKGMDAVVKIGSGIGGFAAGGAITIALEGIALGGLSIAGPVGIAAGVAIAMVGSWLGGAARRGVTQSRGRETKRELEPHIQHFKDELEKTIRDSYAEFSRNVSSQLSEYANTRREQLTVMEDRIRQFQAQGMEFGLKLEELKDDKQYLENWKG